jgi:hypothetical protein
MHVKRLQHILTKYEPALQDPALMIDEGCKIAARHRTDPELAIFLWLLIGQYAVLADQLAEVQREVPHGSR